jgi:glycosyltransferase involved in cell wall biosynthesis
MRILTICHEYPPIGGGGATACRILAEALVRAGHDVHVVTSRMPDLPRQELQAGVTIHRTACLRRARHYSTAAELASWLPAAFLTVSRLVRQRQYDLIHCHFIVPGGIVAAALARRSRLPLVITAHGSDVPGYNPDRFALVHRLIAPGWSRVIGMSAALTVPSAHLAGLLARQTEHPIHVIANPFDAGPPGAVERTDRILVVARLVERKGVQTLIAALEGLETGFEIVVVGEGPHLAKLQGLAQARTVEVSFTGFLPREELSEHYARARIFAFPSIQENFPMVLLEAMAHGCAVITTEAAGCAEVVGDAALLVPPEDVEALRHAILRLTRDSRLTNQLAYRATQRVKEFASERIAAQFEHLFETVLTFVPRHLASASSVLGLVL